MVKKNKQLSIDLVKRKTKFYTIVAGVLVVIILGIGFLARNESKTEYVKKNVVNQYVCKIVGSAPDEDILALECLTK